MSNRRKFNEWLAALPLADTDRLATILRDALKNLDATTMRPGKRLEWLEAILVPLLHAQRDFTLRLVGQALPVSSEKKQLAAHSADLLRQMDRGYQAVLNETQSWLSRLLGKNRAALASQRRLLLLDILVTQHRLVGKHLPDGQWQEAHRLFRRASDAKYLRRRIASPERAGIKTSIAESYCRVLLTALAPLQLFDRGAYANFLATMPAWTRRLRLADVTTDEPSFCVDLDSDRPPAPHCIVGGPGHGQLRRLDARPLDTELNRLLKRQSHDPVTVKTPGGKIPLYRLQLLELQRAWCKPPQRLHERHDAKRTSEAVIGLSALFHLLSARPDEQTQPARPLTQPPESRTASKVDVWETIYGAAWRPPQPTARWQDSDRKSAYQVLTAVLEDISAGGFSLTIPIMPNVSVRVGDLVGIRSRHGNWHFGVSRWVTEVEGDSRQLRVGVELLAYGCRPLSIVAAVTGRPKVRVDAIAGSLRDHRTVIAVPRLCPLENAELSTTIDQRSIPLKINRIAFTSPLFFLLGVEHLEVLPAEPEPSELS